jgi:mRNA-degrading endonuclease toxin of MazEF toxin-antitoxin module
MPKKHAPVSCFAGQVWRIPDDLLTFADSNPTLRTSHPSRPVLVIQGDNFGHNADCPTVLIAPLSGKTYQKRPWEDQIAPEESPLKRNSIVKLQLIQPLHREVLLERSTYLGELSKEATARIFAHIIQNLTGLTNELHLRSPRDHS